MRKKMLMINKRAQSLFSVDKHLKRGSDQVYVFICPICGKRIKSLYLNQIRQQAREHLAWHRRGRPKFKLFK